MMDGQVCFDKCLHVYLQSIQQQQPVPKERPG